MAKEAAQIGVWEFNVKTGQLIWDTHMFLLYDRDPSTFTGTISEWNDVLHPDDRKMTIKAIEITVEQKKKFDTTFRILTPNKQVRYLKAYGHPVVDNNDKVCKIIGVKYDLTENFTIQENLKESLRENRVLAKVAEETVNAVVLTNELGKIIWVNQGFTRISGYQLDEVKGFSPGSILQGKDTDPDTIKDMRNALKNKQGFNVEVLNYHKTDAPYWLRISCQPLHEQNKLVGFMAIETDITELKLAEEQAKEASRAKSDFLANMSHEIRTPLNGILGMNDLLLNSNLDDNQRHFAQLVKVSSHSLQHLINDILDFSKIEAGKLKIELQDINLYTLLSDIIESMASRAHDKHLELILDIAPSLPRWVIIDPDRVKQVLNNLLSNAIKFTEKGEVILRVESTAEQLLKFAIIDTGVGIAENKQGQLFSKFMQVDSSSTRQHGGTGLGLAISKQLTEMMGGQITVQSALQQGSTFCFTVKPKISSQTSTPTTQNILAPLRGKRLLVVDSQNSVRQSVVNFLQPGNIDVQGVSNAPEAIKALRHAQGTEQAVDYILIDLALSGMDGLELSKAIRADKRFSKLFIILMTAQVGAAKKAHNPAINITGYLGKPLKPDTLISALLTTQDKEPAVDQRQFRRVNPSERLDLKKPNILIVEDNYINQQVVIEMLKNLHCHYHLAENGQEALNVLKNHKQLFDLILMDCQMPLMNGYDATRHIRANEDAQFDKNIPIIALTANAMKGDDTECLEAGMNDYLAKPILSEQLAKILDKWVVRERRQKNV